MAPGTYAAAGGRVGRAEVQRAATSRAIASSWAPPCSKVWRSSIFCCAAPRQSERSGGVLDQGANAHREGGRVVDRKKQAVDAILGDFARAGTVGHDHGFGVDERLQQHDRTDVVRGSETKNVGLREKRGLVGHPAGKEQALAEAPRDGPGLQLAVEFAAAGEHAAELHPLVPQPAERLDEDLEAFFRDEPTHRRDDRRRFQRGRGRGAAGRRTMLKNLYTRSAG